MINDYQKEIDRAKEYWDDYYENNYGDLMYEVEDKLQEA